MNENENKPATKDVLSTSNGTATPTEFDFDLVFGTAGSVVKDSLADHDNEYWLGADGGLPPHFYHVDGVGYTGGDDAAHPDWRLESFLLNTRAYKARTFYTYDKSGLSGSNFAEIMASYAVDHKTILNSLVSKMLVDRDLTRNIMEEFVPKNGIQKTDKFLATLLIQEQVMISAKALYPDITQDDLRILSGIYIAILDANGYITDFEDMKSVVVDEALSVDYEMFSRAYLAHHLSDLLSSEVLVMPEASLKDRRDNPRIRLSILVSEMDAVLSRLALVFRTAVNKRIELETALFYTAQMASNSQENVPPEVHAQALSAASNWNLLDYAISLPKGRLSPKEWRASESFRDLETFLVQTEMIELVTAAKLSNHIRVTNTRNPLDGHVECTIIDSARKRMEGRDVFYNAGSIAGFSKIFDSPDVGSGIEGLLDTSKPIMDRDVVLGRLLDSMAQVDFGAKVVLDFSATRQYDRDVLAAALAVTRSHKTTFTHLARNKSGANARIGIVYYVRPTERLTSSKTTVNLNDELRTMDAREVIALTGETKDGMEPLAGYDCRLKLTPGKVNYIDVSKVDFIRKLDEPLYRTMFMPNEGSVNMEPFQLDTSPMKMLNMEELEDVYSTISLTNREDDILIIRMYMTAWMALCAQEKIDPDTQGIKAFKVGVANLVLDRLVDLTIENTIAATTTDNFVRQYANQQGLFRTYGRFYSDERIMANIRMYVASSLVIHLTGVPKEMIQTLHKLVVSTDALSYSLGNRTVARLSQNSRM